MRPKANHGDIVTLDPCDHEELSVGDLVLVRVRGRDYLYLVKAVDRGRYLIGSNRGHVNGWVGRNANSGRATGVFRG